MTDSATTHARATLNGQPESAGNGKLWHRTVWAEAIWSSDLPAVEKIILLCYADHAKDGETAWVTLDRLQERTGLRRRALVRHRQTLVTAGWLVEVSPADHRNAAVYRMVAPEPTSPASQDMSESSQSADWPNRSATPPQVSEEFGPNASPRGAPDAPLGCTTDTPGVHLSPLRGAPDAPNPSTNPSTQPQDLTPVLTPRASFASLTARGGVQGGELSATDDSGHVETHKPLAPLAPFASLTTPNELPTTNDSERVETPGHPSPSTAVLKDAGNDERREQSPTVVGSPETVSPLAGYLTELGVSPEAEDWADGARQSALAGRRRGRVSNVVRVEFPTASGYARPHPTDPPMGGPVGLVDYVADVEPNPFPPGILESPPDPLLPPDDDDDCPDCHEAAS